MIGQKRGNSFTAAAMVTALLSSGSPQLSLRAGTSQVELVGVPVRSVSTIGITVASHASGRRERIFCSFHSGRPPMFIAEIDPATGRVWKHYSPAKSEQGAWAIATGPDGNVYVGTYYTGHLLRFDVRRRAFEDLGRPGHERYFWTFSVGPDGTIYGGTYPSGKLIAYDPASGRAYDLGRTWDDEMYVRHTAVDSTGTVYCGMGSTTSAVVAYNPRTRRTKNLTPPELQGPGFARVAVDERGRVIAQVKGHFFLVRPDTLLPADSTVWAPRQPRLRAGWIVRSSEPSQIDLVDPRTDSTVRSFHVEGDGSVIFSLAVGPDQRLYGSSLLPLRMFAYDPKSGKFEDLRNPTTVDGEIYSFASQSGKLYIAAYPHADLTIYDPQLPWQKGPKRGDNPRNWGRIGFEQDRPIAMVPGQDVRIYIGSIPEYGHLGGALAVYDPESDRMEVYRNIIPDQSVLALVVDPDRGMLIGGTGIQGGPGTRPVAKEAHVFAWDISRRRLVAVATPLAGAKSVRALALVRRWLVGIADTTLFVIDLNSFQTVRRLPFGRPATFTPKFAYGDEGALYAFSDSALCRIAVPNLNVQPLAIVPGRPSAGPVLLDGALYFSVQEKLYRFRLR